MQTYIIAEAGVNHNGSVEIAKKMIDCAKRANVNAIKFQTFIPKNMVAIYAQKAKYQQKNTQINDTQRSMLEQLSLTKNEFKQIKTYCEEQQIEFLSTPFDIESVHFLNTLNMKRWKIPSGEITNLPYLETIADVATDIILSTGMSELHEIKQALSILNKNQSPKITLLHCTTEYPTPFVDVNLNAMQTLKNTFNVNIGYSDHTTGIEVPIAAVAMGATIIEKHFTFDKTMEGPDHKASLNPEELKQMVMAIRNIEQAMGDGQKKPAAAEIKNVPVARKSIVANTTIKKGEQFTEINITTKRPGTGISPMKWYDVLGQVADRDYKEDELIELMER